MSRPKRKWGTYSVENYGPGRFRVRARLKGRLVTVRSGLSEADAYRLADDLTTAPPPAPDTPLLPPPPATRAARDIPNSRPTHAPTVLDSKQEKT